MVKKKVQFSPHIFAEWGELFKNLTTEQRSDILLGITMYPNYNPENNPVWGFIKSQIDKEFELFNERCEKNSQISKSYWDKAKDTERNRMDTERHPKQEHKQEHKQEQKIKTEIERDNLFGNQNNHKSQTENKNKYNHYGEFKNVWLTKEDYDRLSKEHPNLNFAIEKLDGWLETKNGSKEKNRNHRGYFKSNSWVWEKLPQVQPKIDMSIYDVDKDPFEV